MEFSLWQIFRSAVTEPAQIYPESPLSVGDGITNLQIAMETSLCIWNFIQKFQNAISVVFRYEILFGIELRNHLLVRLEPRSICFCRMKLSCHACKFQGNLF